MDYLKKLAGMLVAFACVYLLFTGCNGDDNGNGVVRNYSPVGNWVWVKTDTTEANASSIKKNITTITSIFIFMLIIRIFHPSKN